MSATKLDLRRELHELYAPKRTAAIVEVPELAFVMLDGHGDPGGGPEFRSAVETLYALSYTIKFIVKGASGGIDFRVMPLEGLFWVPDGADFPPADPSRWRWRAMIMQPAPVTGEAVALARERVAAGKPLVERVRFEPFHEGTAAQILHIGPYADEPATIVRLRRFIAERGYEPAGKHHEIYLSDPNRCAPEKLRTVIRYPIASR